MNDNGYRDDLRSYLTGFILALVLTLVPFALVVWGGLAWGTIMAILGGFALVQMVVHLR